MILALVVACAVLIGPLSAQGADMDMDMDTDMFVEASITDAVKALGDSAMSTVMGLFTDDKRNKSSNRDLPQLPRVVDCFGLPASLARLLRSLFRPSPPKVVNTRFFLATRMYPRFRIEVQPGDAFSLEGTGFDPQRRTVIIIHGFMANGSMEWIHEMSAALLRKRDLNVFAVDWSGGGGSWKYWKAVANTVVTGHDLTRFVYKLLDAGMSKDNLHLIGHSLGAHICGFVSRLLGRVARITGLDPAEPCFRVKDPRMTLDKTDATFVDVIHTNAQMLSKLGLGLPITIGHVDFFPNGGMHQPGCATGRTSLLQRVLPITLDKITQAVCSHGRAYMLFTESIDTSNCIFWAHRWDKNQTTIQSSLEAPCQLGNCTAMGYDTDDYPARGVFILNTDDVSPYCVRRPEVDTQMEAALFDRENFIPDDDK